MDKTIALCALVILSPVLLVCTAVLYVVNQGKPFFFQKRPGLHGKIFRIIKLRTMSDKKDAKGHLLADHLRFTPVGSFIRRTSLDEIPQLVNVLRGEMSLVGPRPLLPQYLPLYSDFQNRRHEVKPGITGLAQVNGRNALSWDEKFRYDVQYVDSVSLRTDLAIMLKTVKKVLARKGVNADSLVTMEPFKG